MGGANGFALDQVDTVPIQFQPMTSSTTLPPGNGMCAFDYDWTNNPKTPADNLDQCVAESTDASGLDDLTAVLNDMIGIGNESYTQSNVVDQYQIADATIVDPGTSRAGGAIIPPMKSPPKLTPQEGHDITTKHYMEELNKMSVPICDTKTEVFLVDWPVSRKVPTKPAMDPESFDRMTTNEMIQRVNLCGRGPRVRIMDRYLHTCNSVITNVLMELGISDFILEPESSMPRLTGGACGHAAVDCLCTITSDLAHWDTVDVSRSFDIESVITKYVEDETRHQSEIESPTWLRSEDIQSLITKHTGINYANTPRSGYVKADGTVAKPSVMIVRNVQELKSNVSGVLRVVYKNRYVVKGLPTNEIDMCDWRKNDHYIFHLPRIYYFIVNLSNSHWVPVVVVV
jgi:hypothetical protein